MALTDKQKETITGALNSKAKNHVCPTCLQNNWVLGDELVAAMGVGLNGGGLGIGGPYIPMVQLVCNHCGYIRHHAVGVLGIKVD